jgi:DNA-binding CsgD family transcriptional regulator
VIAAPADESGPAFSRALGRLRSGLTSRVLLTDSVTGLQAVMTASPVQPSSGSPLAGEATVGLVWLTGCSQEVASVKTVSEVFRLTPAEDQLLQQLVAGHALREAARHLKVSIHTVRNQLKSVLRKTGRHTQAQLLTLVTRMASLQAPPVPRVFTIPCGVSFPTTGPP